MVGDNRSPARLIITRHVWHLYWLPQLKRTVSTHIDRTKEWASTYHPTIWAYKSSRSCRNYLIGCINISPTYVIHHPADTSRLAGASIQCPQNDVFDPLAEIAPRLSCARAHHPTVHNRTPPRYPNIRNTWYRPRYDRNSGMRSQSCSKNGRDCNCQWSPYHQ